MATVKVERTTAPEAKPKPAPGTPKTVITDNTGRRLTIQQPSILWESRLVRAMGDAAMNAAYMTGYALPAAMVVDIDGNGVPFPVTQATVPSSR